MAFNRYKSFKAIPTSEHHINTLFFIKSKQGVNGPLGSQRKCTYVSSTKLL
jgi:hypothetical protein